MLLIENDRRTNRSVASGTNENATNLTVLYVVRWLKYIYRLPSRLPPPASERQIATSRQRPSLGRSAGISDRRNERPDGTEGAGRRQNGDLEWQVLPIHVAAAVQGSMKQKVSSARLVQCYIQELDTPAEVCNEGWRLRTNNAAAQARWHL